MEGGAWCAQLALLTPGFVQEGLCWAGISPPNQYIVTGPTKRPQGCVWP